MDLLDNLFNESSRYTFLAGAGISLNSPSNLKTAKEIVKSIVEYCAPEDEADNILTLEKLRYESIIEYIQLIYDEKLSFMDYFEYFNEPNLLHFFLANAIYSGQRVITTNFDYLIEHALSRVFTKEKLSKIIPIITKEDYIKYINPNDLILSGNFPFIKIHGSMRNFFTKEDTSDSLVTTISALGKERERGETFAIEPFKKIPINNVMEDCTLIIIGYSGSDDFDISPTLKELHKLKNLVWINHTTEKKTKIKKIESTQYFEDIKSNSKLYKMLLEIKADKELEIYLVNANTEYFVSNVLWKRILHGVELPEIDTYKESKNIPELSKFIRERFNPRSEFNKRKFSSLIYHSVGNIEKTKQEIEKGLFFSRQTNNLNETGLFLNNLGVVLLEMGDYSDAIQKHSEALSIYSELDNLEEQANTLNKLAFVYFSKSDFNSALEKFKDVLTISEKITDKKVKATCLTNLGELYRLRGKYDKALEMLNEAKNLNNTMGRLSQKAATMNNIGMVYNMKEEYKKASNIYEEALAISEQLGEVQLKASILNSIGMNFKKQNEIDKALENFFESQQIFKNLGFKYQNAGIFNNIGACYFSKQNLDLALKYYNEAFINYENLGNKYGMAMLLSNIGVIYKTKKEFNTAKKMLGESLKIFEELGLNENARIVKEELYEIS